MTEDEKQFTRLIMPFCQYYLKKFSVYHPFIKFDVHHETRTLYLIIPKNDDSNTTETLLATFTFDEAFNFKQ